METKIIEQAGIEKIEITETPRRRIVDKNTLLFQKTRLEERLAEINAQLAQFKK